MKLLNISEKLQNEKVFIKSEVMIEKVSPGMSVEILKLIESNLDYGIENVEMDIEIHLEDVYGLVAKSKIVANTINYNKETNDATNEKN